MDKQRSIALVLAPLILFLCVFGADLFFGPRPEITAGYFLTGILFVGALVWVFWAGYASWKESKAEREELEQTFLEEIEREFLGGGAGDFESVLADGIGNLSAGGASDLGVLATMDPVMESVAGTGDELAPPTTLDSSPLPAAQSASADPAEMPAGSAALSSSFPSGMPSFAPAIEELAANLKRLGVIDTYQGKLDLPPPAPPAPIYRLRNGGLVVLLEDWENHRFLEFQSRRYRAIVVRGPEGKPVVVRCFQDFMTDELEGPKEERG